MRVANHRLPPLALGAAGRVALLALALAATDADASVRFERPANRIVVRGESVTLSSLKARDPTLPLDLVDPARRIWLLRASILLADGARLALLGSAAGGDVNELRLKSDNVPQPDAVVSISADYGSIDIRATRVLSWDSAAGAPDIEYGSYGRAFLRARSHLATDGVRRLESRMDIVDSEVAYLGYGAPESYGLVWKVSGTDNYIFDLVHVRGNVVNSRIHHNYFGLYAAGAHGSAWRHNDVYNNILYGLAPHNHSDGLQIDGNNVHHNGAHGIMLYNRCDDVVIRGNRSWANAKNGIAVRRSSDRTLIEGNHVYDNGDSGIALFASSGATVRSNVVLRNGRTGIQLATGTSDALIADNELGFNGGAALYVHQSSEKPEEGEDGMPRRNRFSGNLVYGSAAAVRVADGRGNRYGGNTFQANGAGFQFSNPQDSDDAGANLYVFDGSAAPAAAVTVAASTPALMVGAFGARGSGRPTAMGFFGLRPRQPRPPGECPSRFGQIVRWEPARGLHVVLDACAASVSDVHPPERDPTALPTRPPCPSGCSDVARAAAPATNRSVR